MSGEIFIPDAATDYFTLLGVPARYNIDRDQIQKRFYELSRVLHPDRFHTRPELLMKATHAFAQLNKAQKTLTNDVARAEYLFELARFEPKNAKSSLPPDLADDYFTLQEALEDDTLSAADKKKQFAAFAAVVKERIAAVDHEKKRLFTEWETSGAPLNASAFPIFEKIAREINQRAYLSSMAQDLEKKCQK